jgi:hypothetical protein
MTRGRALYKHLRSQDSFGLTCVPFPGADTSGHLAPEPLVHLPLQVPSGAPARKLKHRPPRRVPPVSMTLPNQAEGAPGPSLSGTGEIDTMHVLAGCPILRFFLAKGGRR